MYFFELSFWTFLAYIGFIVLIGTIVIVLVYRLYSYFYQRTSYYAITKRSYWSVLNDKGGVGEYRIYRALRFLEKKGNQFLFNLYIPKENGQTTEVDILLLTPTGIFVIESKNYGGWIFGNERSSHWTQSFSVNGRAEKHQFYNPILQNETHIRCLRRLIGDDVPIFSVIAFSDHCELKNVTIDTPNVFVANLSYVPYVVEQVCSALPPALDREDLRALQKCLYPYSQVNEEVKRRHIEDIEANFR